jgi:hypothetical protein
MVTPASRRLTTVAAKFSRQFSEDRDSRARSLRSEPLMQILLGETSLPNAGDASPGARWSLPMRYGALLHIGRCDVRFILVNGRTPRPRSSCVRCDQPVGMNYLREVGTQLIYCDHNCYAAHCESAVLLLDNQATASLNSPACGDGSARSGERTLR